MRLKNFLCYFKSICENKFASFLVLLAAFFIMLSYKITPMLYPIHDKWIFNPYFDTCEVFPLKFFDYLLWIFLFLFLSFTVKFLAEKIQFNTLYRTCKSKYYLLLTLSFFIAWLPYFLTFYPGTITWDDILSMRDPWGYNHQPLLYGYFLKFIWDFEIFLGNDLLGFALFVILKILFMAFTVSYILIFLYKRGISKILLIFFFILFAFLPIFPHYAIGIIKDNFFALFIVFMTLFLYEYSNDYTKIVRETKPFFTFIFLSLMIIWLRNNGIHIMFLTVVVLVILAKNMKVRFLMLAIIFITAGTLPDIGRNVPFKETVGMPIQQIARTLNVGGEISEKNKEIFNNVMPLSMFKENYIAFSADMIKWNPNFNSEYLNAHKKEFLVAWIETFPKNFCAYLTAQAFVTYEFWSISPWQIYRVNEIEPKFPFNTHINQTVYPHAITHDLLKDKHIELNICDLKTSEKVILPENISDKIAFFMIQNLFYLNGGICGIILLISMSITLYKGKRNRIISVLPMLFLWGTLLLATPIFSSFRYVFFFALLMPFIISLPFMTEE